jgi:nitroreductase
MRSDRGSRADKEGSMDSMIDAINRRVSVRAYSDQIIEKDKEQKILDLLNSENKGPFGNEVRFAMIDLTEAERNETKSLGTYGFISGAKRYVVGAVKGSPGAMEDLGYCFEKVILAATGLGLGTCWLGGTFNRANFARRINVSDDEVVPAISPIGYARDKRTVRERLLRRLAKSDQRKLWEELFFDGSMNTPLARGSVGKYAAVLDCVRFGPSASNNQPWRIVRQSSQSAFHLYLKRTWGYDKFNARIDLQRVDIGIAMCHFELAVRDIGLTGRWAGANPGLETGTAEYIISWVES